MISGRPWAAGLVWRQRSHRASEARMARRFHCPFLVHAGTRTGFAGPDGKAGQVSLAAALAAHIGDIDWIALLADDGDGRVALLRQVDGVFPGDGDEIHPGRDQALEALNRLRRPGVRVFASPVLAIDGTTALDAGDIPVTVAMELVAAPRAGVRPWKAVAAASLVVASLAGWLMAGHLLEDRQEAALPAPPAEVEVAIAGAALIEACDRALKSAPVNVPGWHTDEISCDASLQDPGILGTWPAFRSRPALVVRWSLESGHDIELSRRLMEDHVTQSWQLSSVIGRTAWSLTELDPVLVEWTGGERPSFIALRKEVDRVAGPWATTITFQRAPSQPWTVTLTGPPPLRRAHDVLAAVVGLEITRVVSQGRAGWRIDGRMLTPHRLLEEVFEALAAPLAAPGTGEQDA